MRYDFRSCQNQDRKKLLDLISQDTKITSDHSRCIKSVSRQTRKHENHRYRHSHEALETHPKRRMTLQLKCSMTKHLLDATISPPGQTLLWQVLQCFFEMLVEETHERVESKECGIGSWEEKMEWLEKSEGQEQHHTCKQNSILLLHLC